MSTPLLLAAPQAAGYVLGIGRTVPTAAALIALVGVVVGGLAMARRRRRQAVIAVVLGLIGVIVGGLHGANAAGGLGTGNGLAGALIAVALGLIGVVLGWLALAAARRTAGRPSSGRR
ncbi:DUF6223 family protein [Pseudonocardia cypriaca]|uniref:Putative secreted protein with PEP-CTERM sorting signal n=1 Tax=Pseudonocardia cypriaca TaxID=882449 RepID=A0A543FVC1_9PSEU|nr:DUF6223 family protein [Pseudonocardia cypriaca]TQM37753.1 putative secreted protein with PEP-CTERM sorting signal [Pseudonocardia cypriaca]